MDKRHEDSYKKLKFNITYIRKMQGLSQMQLAERIGISRTHMSNIEAPNMNTGISLEILFDIADTLGINIEKLFEIR